MTVPVFVSVYPVAVKCSSVPVFVAVPVAVFQLLLCFPYYNVNCTHLH